MAFDAAGDRIFVSSLWGPIDVFDATTGSLENVLAPGPEVSGNGAWQDEQMGVRAYQRKNGEYLIIEENSGFGAKLNFFRYTPPITH
jgi:hypothetical protein